MICVLRLKVLFFVAAFVSSHGALHERISRRSQDLSGSRLRGTSSREKHIRGDDVEDVAEASVADGDGSLAEESTNDFPSEEDSMQTTGQEADVAQEDSEGSIDGELDNELSEETTQDETGQEEGLVEDVEAGTDQEAVSDFPEEPTDEQNPVEAAEESADDITEETSYDEAPEDVVGLSNVDDQHAEDFESTEEHEESGASEEAGASEDGSSDETAVEDLAGDEVADGEADATESEDSSQDVSEGVEEASENVPEEASEDVSQAVEDVSEDVSEAVEHLSEDVPVEDVPEVVAEDVSESASVVKASDADSWWPEDEVHEEKHAEVKKTDFKVKPQPPKPKKMPPAKPPRHQKARATDDMKLPHGISGNASHLVAHKETQAQKEGRLKADAEIKAMTGHQSDNVDAVRRLLPHMIPKNEGDDDVEVAKASVSSSGDLVPLNLNISLPKKAAPEKQLPVHTNISSPTVTVVVTPPPPVDVAIPGHMGWKKVGRWTERNHTREWEVADKDGEEDEDEDGLGGGGDMMSGFAMLNALGHGATDMDSNEMSDKPPKVVQVLVLTTPAAQNVKRLHSLLAGLDDIGLGGITHAFDGVDASRYKNEAEEEAQDVIPMSPEQREEWQKVTVGEGLGLMHQGMTAQQFHSNGALACALGHHLFWQLAAESDTEEQRAWTIILEDDAHIAHMHDKLAIQKVLAEVPAGVHIVHLDDRHCKYSTGGVQGRELSSWAPGSTAYAVTSVGAKLLLAEPFSHLSDHWLNAPVHRGMMKAYCPDTGNPAFTHEYAHDSTINAIMPTPKSERE